MKLKKLKSGILLVILLGFIATEAYLRVNYSRELAVGEIKDSFFQDDSVLFYTYKPGIKFEVGGKEVYINKHGYIGPEIQPKSDEVFRIAIIGPCNVAGSVHQPEYHSFCPLLEDLLKKDYKVEVINCGIDGDDRSWELFNSIEYKVLDFEPDMILLEYALPFTSENAGRETYRGYKFNYSKYDDKYRLRGREMVDNVCKNEWWIKIVSRSYIIRGIVRKVGAYLDNEFSRYVLLYQEKKVTVKGGWRGMTFTMEESRDLIDTLRGKLNQENIQFFLYQYYKNSDNIAFCRENKLPLISLGIQTGEEDFFYKDGHFNESGCKKIAGRFHELITNNGLIPTIYHK